MTTAVASGVSRNRQQEQEQRQQDRERWAGNLQHGLAL